MRCDVAIAGGGVAGAVAGYTSARLGRDTIIVDAPARHRPGEALAAGGVSVLERLGLGDLVRTPDHVHCPRVEHSGWRSNLPDPWHGIILDRAKFEGDLLAAALAAGCRHMHGEFKSVNATNANDHVLAAETIGELIDIETRIVIDASGRRTAAARQLGSSRQVLTNLVASWATLPLGAITAAPGLLAIEAIDREWWYVAVGRRSIAAAVLGRRPPRRSDTWIAAARGTDILRSLDASVIVFPAAQAANVSITEPLCGDNWFAAGDAAASFDPLSGYGLSFAIGTGHAAACAADARLRDERIAPLSYAALITDRIARTMAGMDEAYRALAAARTGSP